MNVCIFLFQSDKEAAIVLRMILLVNERNAKYTIEICKFTQFIGIQRLNVKLPKC